MLDSNARRIPGDGVSTNIPTLITYWDNVRKVTLDYLDSYPPHELDFRPSPSVFTARQQFQHIIASEVMFVRGWTEHVWDYPWRDGKWVATDVIEPESLQTIDGIRRFYTSIHAKTVGYLRSLSPDTNGLVIATHKGEFSIEGMVLYAIDEEIHHRAQLGLYMRLLGLEPPPFIQNYGQLAH